MWLLTNFCLTHKLRLVDHPNQLLCVLFLVQGKSLYLILFEEGLSSLLSY